ncbi:MAG: hypothetical protein MK185_08270 [Saccharospirillaceae bacterium]|nr:hypothetical protein A3759_01315 [Thalassolituus sp. HI0120]KZZ47876.1 hypothetical protein A3759_28790 [Thalassolituus sp. HI0120]MCH2040613.1 hypothetical protein [Saccharospirillaceae bacterium]
MNAEMQPLFWRISQTKQQGINVVSLLMPADAGGDVAEVPMDVSFPSKSPCYEPQDLRWSEEDSSLFLDLIERVVDTNDRPDIELDLNDDVVQGIVQLVALHRFQTPRPLDELLADDVITEREELEIGDLVSLNTHFGAPLAIIVGLDAIDATCVLLDPLINAEGDILIPDHSVLMVNRLAVLPAAFAVTDNGEGAILH